MNKQLTDRAFRDAYSIYEWFRNQPVITESSTSKILHNPDFIMIGNKLREELREARDVVDGLHKHSGRLQEDLEFEGHQGWYWLSLANAASGMPYDFIRPSDHIIAGYGGDDIPDVPLLLGTQELPQTTERVMKSIGKLCKMADIPPERIALHDIQVSISDSREMKPYLQEAVMGMEYALEY